MDFGEFLLWSERAARSTPPVSRLCETRITRALASILPGRSTPLDVSHVHHCDLVRLWCERQGLSSALAENALASEGVRHALQIIFQLLAQSGTTVALPRDVYPV